MNMYEAIYNRKSVRAYRQERLTDQLLGQIKKYVEELVPLDPAISFCIDIVDNTDGRISIKGLWKVQAPYYLLVSSEGKDGFQRNAGFVAEQMALYLTRKGVGTCYLGASSIEGHKEVPGMQQVILLAMGTPQEKPYRDALLAKRIPLKELCLYKEEPSEELRNILKAARLAPSSMNVQPWRFVVYNNRLHLFARKEGWCAGLVTSYLEFNLGIVLSHLAIAAEEFWLNAEFTTISGVAEKQYKNNQYVSSVLFH